MGHRIATVAALLTIATLVVFAQAWPGSPAAARAQAPYVDLVVTKSDNPDPIVSGGALTYTIMVSNNGTATAGSPGTPVNILDHLPLQFTFGSSFISPTGSCVFVPPQDVQCQVDTLGPGDSVTITIDGYITLPYGGTVTNPAFVDLPVSWIPESIEISNNVDVENTTILAISTPSPTPTPTPTATASSTETPTLTPTNTATPTYTPRPVGGFSRDPGGRLSSPNVLSSWSSLAIAALLCLTLLAAGAARRYVKGWGGSRRSRNRPN